MAWVVDTCLLIDVAGADPTFGVPSAQLLDTKRPDGLVLCPVTYVELAPVFNGDLKAQDEFLFNPGSPGRRLGHRRTPRKRITRGTATSPPGARPSSSSAHWRTFWLVRSLRGSMDS